MANSQPMWFRYLAGVAQAIDDAFRASLLASALAIVITLVDISIGASKPLDLLPVFLVLLVAYPFAALAFQLLGILLIDPITNRLCRDLIPSCQIDTSNDVCTLLEKFLHHDLPKVIPVALAIATIRRLPLPDGDVGFWSVLLAVFYTMVVTLTPALRLLGRRLYPPKQPDGATS